MDFDQLFHPHLLGFEQHPAYNHIWVVYNDDKHEAAPPYRYRFERVKHAQASKGYYWLVFYGDMTHLFDMAGNTTLAEFYELIHLCLAKHVTYFKAIERQQKLDNFLA